jgi:hypothetical protein
MKRALLVCILLIVWSALPALAAGKHIGTVKAYKGIVSVMRSGKPIPARPYLKLYLSDVIMTGSNGSVGVMLEDNTLLSMGPMSRLVLDEFKFEPADNQYAMRLTMQQGTFVYLSGLLGKLAPNAVELDTPVGTISMIQETDFMASFPEQPQP